MEPPRHGAGADVFPEGVQPLDHTADIGMDVLAPTLPKLFCRAAAGLVAFTCPRQDSVSTLAMRGSVRKGGFVVETVRLEADDAALLLVAWLRELLFHMETRTLCFVDAEFDVLDEHALRARARLAPCPPAIREIKGVTYHELQVRREGEEWRARVIFDV